MKRYEPCSGSGEPPVVRYLQVGICSGCGVRTFLDGDRIQRHKATRSDIQEFAVRPRKVGSGL